MLLCKNGTLTNEIGCKENCVNGNGNTPLKKIISMHENTINH